ncbi:MAG: hypothetical protein PHF60_02120 [Candidatus ainarchaeum sp.]|nr:hypothetical protein [Candidatus ainarchaeum sp.]
MLDKKGFLFTVTVFLILMYVLLSISVWVKAIESSERAFSEFYKESTVELTMEQITPGKMDDTSYTIMNRNLMRLNEGAEEFAVKAGPPDDENLYVRTAMLELLINGSAAPDDFEGPAPGLAEENASLRAWVNDLNASLKAIGVYVDKFEVSDFQIGQSGIDKVNYSFKLKLGLKDFANTSSVSRTYDISNQLGITGFVDPALVRQSRDTAGDDITVYRQFFFNKDDYPDSASISVTKMSQSVNAGQGWLYAPMAMAGAAGDLVPTATTIDPNKTKDYILVGTFDEIDALTADVYSNFAGFIVTTSPNLTSILCNGEKFEESNTFNPISYSAPPDCLVEMDASKGIVTSKPFMVAPNFDPADADTCPLLDGTNLTGRCVLMINSYSEAEVGDDLAKKKAATTYRGLYKVESIRDFVMCGYYTNNPKAPSYLQHLLPDPYFRNSTLGIETFVIGNYANKYSVYDTNSRLDRELFNTTISGVKVRGLPGCKSFSACSDSPVTGIFAVSEDTKADYGLDNIACDNGAAGCGS